MGTSSRRRRLVLLVPALTAAAALTGVLLLPAGGGSQPDVQPRSTASQFLLASAERVNAEPQDDPLDQAEWWYVRSRFEGLGEDAGTREIWLGRTKPGRVLVERPPGAQTPGFDAPLPEPADFHGMSWDELIAMSTTTSELRREVYALASTGGRGEHAQAFVVVGDLLRESPVPSPLRAALLRVAATIPGVVLEQRTVDPEGRPVVPVSLQEDDGSLITRLILDPDNGTLLGEEIVALRDLTAAQVGEPVAAGAVLHRTTRLEAGAAPAVGLRP